MNATIQVNRILFYRRKVYQRCESLCNVKLSDVDQVMNIPASVKNIRKILLAMGYDQIEVKQSKKYQSMDNFQHKAKLKEIEERKAYIEANPDLTNKQLAKKWKVCISTIEKDKKKIANRKEFE